MLAKVFSISKNRMKMHKETAAGRLRKAVLRKTDKMSASSRWYLF